MRTVKELSDITGISVRTLHYYDEIGLLKPTGKSTAGYRLYDDEALEKLQQILFFREFEIPLKEIRSVLDTPSFDRDQTLRMQRSLLLAKKLRLERLIGSIDDILKGEKEMDFGVFSKTEIDEILDSMISNMNEEQKKRLAENYGSAAGFREYFMESVSDEKVRENWRKLVEWYGGKENALDVARNPVGEEEIRACRERQEEIMQKLMGGRGNCPPDCKAANAFVAEYANAQKRLFRFQYEKDIMLGMADIYRNHTQVREMCDKQYGEGAAAYFADAVYAFYRDAPR